MTNTVDQELAGRCAVVTGGTRGIGAAVTARLAAAGADVLTTARSAPARVHPGTRFVATDVRTWPTRSRRPGSE